MPQGPQLKFPIGTLVYKAGSPYKVTGWMQSRDASGGPAMTYQLDAGSVFVNESELSDSLVVADAAPAPAAGATGTAEAAPAPAAEPAAAEPAAAGQ